MELRLEDWVEKVLDEVGEPGISGTAGGGGGVRRGRLLSNEASLGTTTGVSRKTSP